MKFTTAPSMLSEDRELLDRRHELKGLAVLDLISRVNAVMPTHGQFVVVGQGKYQAILWVYQDPITNREVNLRIDQYGIIGNPYFPTY